MDFVWQYIRSQSSWDKSGLLNELEYSVKSVRKFYKGKTRCFVVGDDPLLDVIHLEAPQRVEIHVSNQPRYVDQARKQWVMVNNKDINDDFVLMYDDIFLLQPTSEKEIKTRYGRKEITSIEEYMKERLGDMGYKRIWKATYDYVKMLRDGKGLKTYDWEAHLPRYMVKEKLKWVIKTFDLVNTPKLISGVYDGHFNKKTTLISEMTQADLWTHNPGMDLAFEFTKKYMNIYDDAIIPELVERMKEHMA